MNLKNKVIVGSISIFLLSGCAQPTFNKNVASIVFVEGKPYRIPNATTHKSHTYKNIKTDRVKLSALNRNGIRCKVGDVFWATPSSLDQVAKIHKSNGKEQAYRFMARSGKAGCAHPLSSREYNHYKGKEREASANARAKAASNAAAYSDYMNYKAATATRSVNVQHSGNINLNQNAIHSDYINVYNR